MAGPVNSSGRQSVIAAIDGGYANGTRPNTLSSRAAYSAAPRYTGACANRLSAPTWSSWRCVMNTARMSSGR